MDFRFDVNDMFKQNIVEINANLIPPGFCAPDRRALWDGVSKVSEVINKMGEASAAAQGLTKPITTSDKLRNSEHKIYLLVDKDAKSGKGIVTGMLKVGRKGLYVFDRDGHHFQVTPPCVLDFYIHETRQRTGLGKKLFEHMLEKEDIEPVKMAIDRPSDKFLAFLNKHYNLQSPIKQMNNYVVFDGFFPETNGKPAPPPPENEDNTTPTRKQTANGLQSGFAMAYGRYGAPRPPCSMGQIIHNQSPLAQQPQEPTGNSLNIRPGAKHSQGYYLQQQYSSNQTQVGQGEDTAQANSQNNPQVPQAQFSLTHQTNNSMQIPHNQQAQYYQQSPEQMTSPQQTITSTQPQRASPQQQIVPTHHQMISSQQQIIPTQQQMISPQQQIDFSQYQMTVPQQQNVPIQHQMTSTQQQSVLPLEQMFSPQQMALPQEKIQYQTGLSKQSTFATTSHQQMTPSHYQMVPSQQQIVPSQQQIVPNQPQIISSQQQIVPDQQQILPMNMNQQVVPNQQQAFPNQQQIVPSQQQIVPNQPQIVPSQQQIVPVNMNQQVVPNQQQIFPNQRQIVPNQPQIISSQQHIVPNQEQIVPSQLQIVQSQQEQVFSPQQQIVPPQQQMVPPQQQTALAEAQQTQFYNASTNQSEQNLITPSNLHMSNAQVPQQMYANQPQPQQSYFYTSQPLQENSSIANAPFQQNTSPQSYAYNAQSNTQNTIQISPQNAQIFHTPQNGNAQSEIIGRQMTKSKQKLEQLQSNRLLRLGSAKVVQNGLQDDEEKSDLRDYLMMKANARAGGQIGGDQIQATSPTLNYEYTGYPRQYIGAVQQAQTVLPTQNAQVYSNPPPLQHTPPAPLPPQGGQTYAYASHSQQQIDQNPTGYPSQYPPSTHQKPPADEHNPEIRPITPHVKKSVQFAPSPDHHQFAEPYEQAAQPQQAGGGGHPQFAEPNEQAAQPQQAGGGGANMFVDSNIQNLASYPQSVQYSQPTPPIPAQAEPIHTAKSAPGEDQPSTAFSVNQSQSRPNTTPHSQQANQYQYYNSRPETVQSHAEGPNVKHPNLQVHHPGTAGAFVPNESGESSPKAEEEQETEPAPPPPPKLERPQSLSLQQSEEIADDSDGGKVGDVVESKVPLSPATHDLENGVEKIKLAAADAGGDGDAPASVKNDDAAKGAEARKTPSHLTEQGFFDLKFYHNKLW